MQHFGAPPDRPGWLVHYGRLKAAWRALHGAGTLGSVVRLFRAQILILALNVAGGVILARTLGPEGRGQQAVMVFWPQIVAFVVPLGVPAALSYYLKQNLRDRGELIGTALLLNLAIASVGALAGALVVPSFLSHYPDEIVRFTQFGMVGVLAAPVTYSFLGILQADEKFGPMARVMYLTPVMLVLAFMALWSFDLLNPLTATAAVYVSGIPSLVCAVIWAGSVSKFTMPRSTTSARALLSYGIRLYGSDIGNLLNRSVDRMLIFVLLDAKAAGLYVVAANLGQPLLSLPAALSTVLFPKLAERTASEAGHYMASAYRIFSLVLGGGGVVLLLLAPFLLIELYGPSFAPAVAPFRILVLDIILTGLTQTLAQAFLAGGRPQFPIFVHALGLAVVVPAIYFFAPMAGVVGVAIAVVVGSLARLGLTIILYRRSFGANRESLLPGRADIVFLMRKLNLRPTPS